MMNRLALDVTLGAGIALFLVACGSSSSKEDGGGPSKEPPAEEGVTWSKDVAPLVAEKCAGCHSDGGIAPFSMDRYEDVVPFAGLMAKQVEAGTMPPWLAEDTD